jgi:hypothetical protein
VYDTYAKVVEYFSNFALQSQKKVTTVIRTQLPEEYVKHILPTHAPLPATFLCSSVSASIRSANPSTSVKSKRPARNARLVNSPASAGRRKGSRARAERSEAINARPEWVCSSRVGSVVKDLGATVT